MSDTPRLLERPEEGGELLRSILASAEGDAPSAVQAAKLVAALDLALAPGPGGAPPAAPAAAAGSVGAVGKLLALGTLALGAMGVGAALLSQPASSKAPVERAVPAASAPVKTPNEAAPSLAPSALPAVEASDSQHADPRTPSGAAKPSVASAAPSAPPARFASETELLSAAQRALASRQSATALSLREEHRLAFPRGVFHEELERIAIEALLQQGQRGPAERRAAAFFKRYPSSVHRSRLEGLLGARAKP